MTLLPSFRTTAAAAVFIATGAALAVVACSDDSTSGGGGNNTTTDGGSEASTNVPPPVVDQCADASKPTHTCTAAQCTTQNGEPSICVEDQCVKLKSQECADVYGATDNDDAIVIGSLLSLHGTDAVNGIPRTQSAALAVKEINAKGGVYTSDGCGRRPLIYVSCDDSNAALPNDAGTYNRVNAAHHLTDDLQVAGIIGGMNTANSQAAAPVTFAAQVPLFPPSASAISLTAMDGGKPDGTPLVWRLTPSDAYQAQAMAAVGVEVSTLVNKPTTTKVAVLYRDDSFGNELFAEIKKYLKVNGKSFDDADNTDFVMSRKYPPAAVPQSVVDDTLAFQPDIIYGFYQGEFSAGFLAKYEAANTAGIKPQYITTKSGQRQDQINVMKTLGPTVNVKARLRGTSEFIITPLMQSFFNLSFKPEYPDQTALLAGMPNSYDGVYVIAYAIQGTAPTYAHVKGIDVAKNIHKVAGGTTKINAGPSQFNDGLQALLKGDSIDFTGASAGFDYDENGNMPGNFTTWCVKTDPNDATNLLYENATGQIWDYKTTTLTGTFVCPN